MLVLRYLRPRVSRKWAGQKVRLSVESNNNARKGFGSFHSEDIETLIKPDHAAGMPALMREINEQVLSRSHQSLQQVSMGKPARDNLFVLDKKFDFLNHGAFGAVMEPLLHASHLWRYECERQPLKFFDRELFPLVAYSLKAMANFVSCPATELYPLQNVTTGLNCVLQSVSLQPGDEVICFSLTYGSTKKMLKDLCDRTGATLRIIQLTLPVANDESIVRSLTNTLSDKTRLVIIDHITSNTALVMPTLQLAQAARQAGALVVIDAAHALFAQNVGIYPINAGDKGTAKRELCIADVADVWLTNGHKWLSAPKGCAFMWAHPSVARHLRPAVVSHGFYSYLDAYSAAEKTSNTTYADVKNMATSDDRKHNMRWWHEAAPHAAQRAASVQSLRLPPSKLLSSLAWDGCRDYTALLCTPLALQIWDGLPVGVDALQKLQRSNYDKLVGADSVSMDMCRAYMRTLLHAMVVPMLIEEWGLREEDFAGPRSMRLDSPMVLVPLPESVRGYANTRQNMEDRHAFAIQETLHHEHNIEVPIKCLEGRLYVRLSAHIHNSFDQYERLAAVIKNM